MYKVEVLADNSGVWTGNGLTFATKQEAIAYAKNLFMRWTAVREYRVVRASRVYMIRLESKDGTVYFRVRQSSLATMHGVCNYAYRHAKKIFGDSFDTVSVSALETFLANRFSSGF
jgi:1,2-phenylacetyl-CoA epoxidase PaaB subunit